LFSNSRKNQQLSFVKFSIGQIPSLEIFGIEFVEKDTREVLHLQGGDNDVRRCSVSVKTIIFTESKDLVWYKEKKEMGLS